MEPVNGYGTSDNGKIAGIISYFTIIGWLIAYFAFHQNNKTRLGSYQLRQTLLFHIVSMIVSYGFGFIVGAVIVSDGSLTIYYILRLLQLALFVIWVIGLIGAIQGQEKPIPLMGERAQSMFPAI